ncbi:proteasome assembly chaperone family protein, partial [Candidatus Woesearchaeota archaeon]|nr:proteasome assembly chaperone family protein [Candidatus Woesearchaeota archaeon]
MEVILEKKPKNPVIVEGFPGFGLIGTIGTEFLMNNLEVEQIGQIYFDDMPAVVAVHDHKIIHPFGIYYNKKHNLIIIHAITSSAGLEWKITEAILKLADTLQAKEIICLEGVGSNDANKEEPETYYYTNEPKMKKKLEELKVKPLKEGIIMGITGTILLKGSDKHKVSCLFAETHSKLPDSRAAAKIIGEVNKYLALGIDTKPLMAQADKFEKKIQSLM